MTANALSKKACSKPSCISISSTAKPMPPAERSSRDLFETRLRQASGTEPGCAIPASPAGGCRRGAEGADKKAALSEHVRGRDAAQNADRQQRRNQGHGDSSGKHG